LLACIVLLLPGMVFADDQTQVYKAMGLEAKDVLAGTVLNAPAIAGASGRKQVICVATYLTGKKDKEDAVNVRLMIFNRRGELLEPIYSRDFGQESGGFIGKGNLEMVDLDHDGAQEIIVSFQTYKEPLIEQRLAEVILHDGSDFHTAWAGPLEYDATKAARDMPVERRDRYMRRFDFQKTLRSRGSTLFISKHMIAVAGERLPTPKVVEEAFPLRPRER
jgi:hypothetical protein